MKILIALCAIFTVCTARVAVITAVDPANLDLLGVEECTWGPSYWCENIKNAAGCNATKHCIKAVWENLQVPEDNDSVCGICKDMVQQARDQLNSNETQKDIKAVFEGSCKLIRLKLVVKECTVIVDQFIPELIETLSSQMNPSVVCSVAGLCNSVRVDKLLEDKYSKHQIKELKSRSLEKDEFEPDECSKCYTVAAHMEHKLNNTSRDNILEQMLEFCTNFNSFTDTCSEIILTYIDTIYAYLQENFNAQNLCHLSGQCSAQFHNHEDADKTLKVEIRPLSSVGMVDVNDDLPCQLCEQLVNHLRDVLVANTTELEFEQVLRGLCKQTKSFSAECLVIVDEYYLQIYDYLTHGLDSKFICQMTGICVASTKTLQNGPIWPLVSRDAAEIGRRSFQGRNKNLEGANKHLSESEVESMQLPIERLVPFPISEGLLGVGGTETCALCEYILHYLQEVVTNPATEDDIKKGLAEVCERLPQSITGQCTQFVDVYGDAVVAILAQEIDPSKVCPMLRLCPGEQLMKFWENVPPKYMLEEKESKTNCPLCLLAVTEVYEVVKDNRTEATIEFVLKKLCDQLPPFLYGECSDFVKNFSKEIIELLLADLTPQEICVYLKICDAKKNPSPRDGFITDRNGEILSNEIPNTLIKSEVSEPEPGCVICEFAMHFIDKELGNKKGKTEVEEAVRGVCNHLPKSVKRKCNNFVDKYVDVVIDMITKDVSPKQVCGAIGLCASYIEEMKASVTECALCKSIISMIDDLLDNQNVDDDIKKVVFKVCKYLPASKENKCTTLINSYGQSIINLVKQRENIYKICSKIGLCAPNDYSMVYLENSRIKRSYEKNRIKHCTWGPVYWCSTNETAHECKAVEHCKENVWKADFAPPKQITLSETEPNI